MSHATFLLANVLWLLGSLWAVRVAYLAGYREGRARTRWLLGLDKNYDR